MAKKKTVLDFYKMKEAGEKFTELALYDFTMAMLAEQAGLEMISWWETRWETSSMAMTAPFR